MFNKKKNNNEFIKKFWQPNLKNFYSKTKTNEELKFLVELKHPDDVYYLDETNAILIYRGYLLKEPYVFIHYRLIDNRLQEIMRWQANKYYWGYDEEDTIIPKYHAFKMREGRRTVGLYNYKDGKIVIEPGTWDNLYFGTLEKYESILAEFNVTSDYEEGDTFTYINPVTNEQLVNSFTIKDGKYFGILNYAGQIKGHKLFRGKEFSKIEETIDLNDYDINSINDFKDQRRYVCNELKNMQKREYLEQLKTRNCQNNSPYLDEEVLEIVKK